MFDTACVKNIIFLYFVYSNTTLNSLISREHFPELIL